MRAARYSWPVPDEFPEFDLYAELEVSERASVETIQAAFRSLQLRNHPDLAGPVGDGRAARLNIARDWLTDPARRARFDAHLDEARRRAAIELESEHSDAETDDDYDADAELLDGEALADTRGVGLLHVLRHHLRIDARRLGRIWIVGLGLLGAIALVPGVVEPTGLRIGTACVTVVVLLGLGLGAGRDSEGGMATLMTRWIAMLLGWVLLAVLAVEGVATLVALVGGGQTPAGVSDLAVPAIAVTALLSLFAVRRRHGPAETTVDEFLEMTPSGFEEQVGRILGWHGYSLVQTGGPGDLVADLAGTDPDGRPTVVQCKRYAPGHPVGSRDVQLLIAMGVRHHNAERLVLVTTSDFTDPARDLADEHGVTLISGEDLEDLTR